MTNVEGIPKSEHQRKANRSCLAVSDFEVWAFVIGHSSFGFQFGEASMRATEQIEQIGKRGGSEGADDHCPANELLVPSAV